MAKFTERQCTDNGLIMQCKIDGVKTVYINPDWTGDNLRDMLIAAGAGAGAFSLLLPGIGTVIGAFLSSFAYIAINREGYYEVAYDGKLTKNIIWEGVVYEHQLT